MENWIFVMIAILFYIALGFGLTCLCAFFISSIWWSPVFYILTVICSVAWFLGLVSLGYYLDDKAAIEEDNDPDTWDF